MNSMMRDKADLKEKLSGYLLDMVRPLEKHYSEGKAGLWLGGFAAGYGLKTAEMEGALRVLWGLTPYWAGGGKEAESFKDIYLQIVRHGTDPDDPEYWGGLKDRDQKIVEMAALSVNLLMTPEVIWDRMTSKEQDDLAAWLYQVNTVQVSESNWNFFVLIPNLALKRCGKPYSQEQIDFSIKKYESYYLGNGWYGDGKRPQKDYYIPFGIQFYCLLYAYFMKEEDPERCRLYRERAVTFAETFRYWFDDCGRAVPFGRSQTYRFAQAAFFSILPVVMGEKCPYRGEIKRLLRLHMEHWMAQPIFDNGGILTVGYHYPNLNMSESYNSPGSPYWAFKFFFCLALDDKDSFWSEEEREQVFEPVKTIPECDMVLLHEPGHVISLTAGQYPVVVHLYSDAKYAKFAYSSVFGFSVPRSSRELNRCAPDSMLAFGVYENWYVRRRCITHSAEGGRIKAMWSPVAGITVETELIPASHGYIRRHRIETEIACQICECGFAYPDTRNTVCVSGEEAAEAGDSNGHSRIASVVTCAGQPVKTQGVVITPEPNTNVIYSLTKIPGVQADLEPGSYEVVTTVEAVMNSGRIVCGRGESYVLE